MIEGRHILKNEFVPAGTMTVSTAALNYARDFIATVTAAHGGDYIAAFDWSQAITVRSTPVAKPEPRHDCVMLGAAQRADVPPEAIHTIDGVEFVVELPAEILRASAQRLIDLDNSAFFKFVLR